MNIKIRCAISNRDENNLNLFNAEIVIYIEKDPDFYSLGRHCVAIGLPYARAEEVALKIQKEIEERLMKKAKEILSEWPLVKE